MPQEAGPFRVGYCSTHFPGAFFPAAIAILRRGSRPISSMARSFGLAVQQNLVGLRAAFADAGDLDGGVIFHGAGELAGAASHAAGRIDVRLANCLRVSLGVGHVDGAQVNRFGRRGAPLLADDAFGRHGPGQAVPAVVESRAQADGLGVLGGARGQPGFLRRRDFPDGAGGADLAAKHATGLAIADARHQRRASTSPPPPLPSRPAAGHCWGKPSCTRRSECSARESSSHRGPQAAGSGADPVAAEVPGLSAESAGARRPPPLP